MKAPWFALVLLASLLAGPFCTAHAGNVAQERLFNMTATEVEEIVRGYLNDNSFQFYYETQSDNRISMVAEKGAVQLRIVAQRHSPIASRVTVDPFRAEARAEAEALIRYLDGYINLPNQQPLYFSDGIPDAVRRHNKAVVCLYAIGRKSEIQLTGFAVDGSGLIVCTGHDLDIDDPINVIFSDGREVNGRVIKLDHQSDLGLIKVPIALHATVPLRDGRFTLKNGDRLFAVTCPNGSLPAIEPGFIDGPPRRVQGMPLWQVQMRIKHGSSGSPVFDSQGRVVAVVKGRFRGTDSIGFLIPFEIVLQFLENE